MERTCEVCAATFNRSPYDVRAGTGRYCSVACFVSTRRTKVEMTCVQCGGAFTVKRCEALKERTKFCSRSCADAAKRGPRKGGIEHRMMKATGHPIAPASGTAPVSRVRLYDQIGPGPHPCHWCGAPVNWIPGVGVRRPDVLVVDHLDHDPTNDEVDNLVPSCNSCNSHRRRGGTAAIIQEGEKFVMHSGGRRRAVERECESCGCSFLAAVTEVNGGKGRFCSRSCARRAPRRTG